MDFRKKFAVEPESKVRLSKIDPSYSGKHSREEVQSEIQRHVERIDKSQYLLYADGNQSLLIVLQALDAAGKDGVIRHVFSGMNPQGTFVNQAKTRPRTISCGAPTFAHLEWARSLSLIDHITRMSLWSGCTILFLIRCGRGAMI